MKEMMLAILILTTSSCLGQVLIGDDTDFEVLPPKGCHSYSIFWYRTYKDERHALEKSKKILIKRAELHNGLVKRIEEFRGSAIISVVEQFYKDTMLVKYTRKFSDKKDKEIYHYQYNQTTNGLVSTIGTVGRKMIYKQVKSYAGDTCIQKTFCDYLGINYSETEHVYFSRDSLVQTKVLFFDDQTDAHFTVNIFATKNVLREKIDSTKDQVYRTIYTYDSLGRLLESRLGDSVYISVTEYSYANNEILASTYGIYENHEKKIQSEHLSRYNKQGMLILEKSIEYGMSEELVSDKPSEVKNVKTTPARIISKSYKNNRLTKVQVSYGDLMCHYYEVIYH